MSSIFLVIHSKYLTYCKTVHIIRLSRKRQRVYLIIKDITHSPNDYIHRGENIDIAKRCKELGIIYFDGAETAVKEDVLTALNAIEANMNVTSDEEMYNRIKELQNAKNTGI